MSTIFATPELDIDPAVFSVMAEQAVRAADPDKGPLVQMVTRTVKVANRRGMHNRPTAAFVKAASAFKSAVRVQGNGRLADGRSSLQLIMLLAVHGTDLTITCSGADAQEAADALAALVAGGFGEGVWTPARFPHHSGIFHGPDGKEIPAAEAFRAWVRLAEDLSVAGGLTDRQRAIATRVYDEEQEKRP